MQKQGRHEDKRLREKYVSFPHLSLIFHSEI